MLVEQYGAFEPTWRTTPRAYEAFNVRPGDRMYLPPERRVKIW